MNPRRFVACSKSVWRSNANKWESCQPVCLGSNGITFVTSEDTPIVNVLNRILFNSCIKSNANICMQYNNINISHRGYFLPRCKECRRGQAMRIPSVRPSVKRVNCDKTEEKSVQIIIPYERSPSFLKKRMVGGGDPFYLKIWVNRPPLEQNRRFWTIFARSASAVTPDEKSSMSCGFKVLTLTF